MKVEAISFFSCNTRCEGDLYLPENVIKPPVIVMAHGFACEKSFRLPSYAQYFCDHGFAVFLFDYRCFGKSDGHPRNLVNPHRHVKDWHSAIDFVKILPQIDSEKVLLWGTSFSGGHVLIAAAARDDIRAVISQVPFVDSVSTSRRLGVRFILRGVPRAFFDILKWTFFRRCHYVKVIGRPNEFAVMNTPESFPGYSRMIPEDNNWVNRCPARILLTFSSYRPILKAKRISCPVLMMAGEKDSLIDHIAVEETVNRIPHGRLELYPCGHFDLYFGEWFKKTVAIQCDFFKGNL